MPDPHHGKPLADAGCPSRNVWPSLRGRHLWALLLLVLGSVLAPFASDRAAAQDTGQGVVRKLENVSFLTPLLIGPAGAFPRWHAVSIALQDQLRDTPGAMRAAKRRARRYRGKPARVIVAAIRTFVLETTRYREDRPHDYWSSPAQTAQLGLGDCEDLAILGLYMALEADVPADRTAVVIGRDRRGNQHAVLVVLDRELRAWTFDVADPGSPPLSRSGFQPSLVGFLGEVGFPRS